MKQTVSRACIALVLAAAIARPAFAANKEQQQMMADIRMLQEQAQQLQNLIGALTTTLNTTINEALKAVNTRLDEQAGINRKLFADQKLVIDTLSSDLKVVREKVDDNNVRIGSLSQEVDALRQGLLQLSAARPPAATEATDGAAAAVPGDGPPQAAASAPAPALAIGTSPQRIWDQAYAQYTIGLYDLAIEGFTAYIRSFPKSDMADDAQVYIGQSYAALGKKDKAVEEYDRAIRTYPGANAIPEAYYRKGIALGDLKQLDDARTAFETVIKMYPDSTAAALSRQRLTAASPK